jgi:sterol desaturase/sphingolipid hydroxylase (fatty acid hydroxylase superfamily)
VTVGPLIAFWVLVLAALTRADRRRAYLQKHAGEWLLDAVGLTVQGGIVPLVQVVALAAALDHFAPAWRGALHPPGHAVGAFVLNFVVVDYLYYWNHRLLHTRTLWPVHLVHHTMREMDVVGTARNTAWTSFLILYVWINGTLAFLLAEPAGYLAGAALTASLDLWRHSSLQPRTGGILERVLGRFLVLPRHHARHHATDSVGGNYGANFSLWDRLHGTFVDVAGVPALGVSTELPLWRQLMWPFA